jgi:chromosome segregation ATPase
MKTHTLFLCFVLFSIQSLADLARKEAERRKQLDQQGVPAKVITQTETSKLAPEGAISVSSIPRTTVSSSGSDKPGKKRSLEKYREELNRLDREIRAGEEHLVSARKKLETEKKRMQLTSAKLRLQEQIQDLETRVKRLKEERLKAYDQARRAGYLPGELDGKGITP